MSNEIGNVFSVYDSILENKKILSEVMISPSEVNYSHIEFHNRTKSDRINKALLDDINGAAKYVDEQMKRENPNAEFKVKVNFAKTGHRQKTKKGTTSRHWLGTGVDISEIKLNGKFLTVSYSTKSTVEKFTNALSQMGYKKNVESDNEKAYLTFGFEGHDDHVHVSNTTGVSSSEPKGSDSTNTSNQTDFTAKEIDPNKRYYQPKEVNPEQRYFEPSVQTESHQVIKEEKIYSSFGNDVVDRGFNLKIPKDKNKNVKSPVNGTIKKQRYNPNCSNQLDIIHDVDGNSFYLEYCNLKTRKTAGDVVPGTIIGEFGDSDVTVTLYNDSNERVPINYYRNKQQSSSSVRSKFEPTTKKKIDPSKRYFEPDLKNHDSSFFSPKFPDTNTRYFPSKDINNDVSTFKEGYSFQKNIRKIRKLLK